MTIVERELDFWRDGAACSGSAAVDFFADDPMSLQRAKATCAGCPVADDCLAYAIETNQPYGTWGGYSSTERNRLRRLWMKDLRQAS